MSSLHIQQVWHTKFLWVINSTWKYNNRTRENDPEKTPFQVMGGLVKWTETRQRWKNSKHYPAMEWWCPPLWPPTQYTCISSSLRCVQSELEMQVHWIVGQRGGCHQFTFCAGDEHFWHWRRTCFKLEMKTQRWRRMCWKHTLEFQTHTHKRTQVAMTSKQNLCWDGYYCHSYLPPKW